VEKYELINDEINVLIGAPIFYEEFLKNGKQNKHGDNLIPVMRTQ
jgi:hypothetical protein